MHPSAYSPTVHGKLIKVRPGSVGEYWAFLPAPLPPSIALSASLISKLARAHFALGGLSELGRALPNPDLLIHPYLFKEAVLSSKIEGTQASLSDLFLYDATGSSESTPSDVREVKNYVVALEYGLDRLKTLPVSLRLVREIHERLMEGVRGGVLTPGEFRTSQNWIGRPGSKLTDATYVPPPPEELIAALSEWETFLHRESELPELIRLALVHYQFEAIHPFLDGNGRVGRLLMMLLLVEWGLLSKPLFYLSAFFENNRSEYYARLLNTSEQGAWNDWLDYFVEAVIVQAEDAMSRSQRMLALRKTYEERLTTLGARVSASIFQFINLLFESPILTSKFASEKTATSSRTTTNYLKVLIELGIIEEITGNYHHRVYRATEILRLLEE
jgi:Fic family protein